MTTRKIGRTTGDGASSHLGVRGTDLGYLTKTNHGYVIATFGDTSDGYFPGEPGWRSPVMLRTSNTPTWITGFAGITPWEVIGLSRL